jgi:hypothetical protein
MTDSIPLAAILTQGESRRWASSRLRGFWLQDTAPGLFKVVPPGAEFPENGGGLNGHQALIFQKRHSQTDRLLAEMAKMKGLTVIFDLTDPLHWFEPQGVKAMADLADAVVCSSAGLADLVRADLNPKRVEVIVDRMKPSYHPTPAQHAERDRPAIVWFGLSLNRASLVGAVPILNYCGALGLPFTLRVIDDLPGQPLEIGGEPPFAVDHVAWALETFHAHLAACDIALLPPYPGPWGAVKSSNKQVTAWWAGLPTVTGFDPIELGRLIQDAELRAEIGARNRATAERDYDIGQSVDEWRDLLCDLGVDDAAL